VAIVSSDLRGPPASPPLPYTRSSALGATQAIRAVHIRDRIPHLSARRLARRAVCVTADVPLAEALRRVHADQAGALVITDHDGRPLGIVSEKAVIATPEHRRPWITAGELSRGV